MAIQAKIRTQFGEDREVYIRLNNVESSNHGEKSTALFRGFLSQEAFKSGAHYVWDQTVEFDCNVSLPIWPQAYAALIAEHALDNVMV